MSIEITDIVQHPEVYHLYMSIKFGRTLASLNKCVIGQEFIAATASTIKLFIKTIRLIFTNQRIPTDVPVFSHPISFLPYRYKISLLNFWYGTSPLSSFQLRQGFSYYFSIVYSKIFLKHFSFLVFLLTFLSITKPHLLPFF